MLPRQAPVPSSPQLAALLQEAARQGPDIMDELLRGTREALQRQIEQTRDLFERDRHARAISALAQVAPELRARFPAALQQAFEQQLGDEPATTSFDTGPSSIRFDQLELMDEQQVQARISAVRGLQQVLLESEVELAELNALVSALLGFEQVRAERNPLRPEVFLEVLQKLLNEMPGEAQARAQWTQAMAPLLGRQLRLVYQSLLGLLRRQRVQPARYAISQPAPRRSGPAGAVPASAAGPARAHTGGGTGTGAPPAPVGLTVQQLHGLVSGSVQDAARLSQEVVNLIIANIAGDPRILPPVWLLVHEMEPALLTLARSDLNFFHDKRHPARLLLEEIVQRSFAYERAEASGFDAFLEQARQVLDGIDPAQAGSPAPFAAALAQLRQQWGQADRARQAQQQAAVQALQQAERRNHLAQQIADHIRAQPDTVLVPDLVVDFACGPWAQAMAQARLEGRAGQPGELDYVALLEDLFWSVRRDQTRQQPGQLTKLIPQLVQGLRQGLQRIRYPEESLQQFLEQLFALHQGSIDGKAARVRHEPPRGEARPWLAPEEARESGFMDDLGPTAGAAQAGEAADFPATVPAGLPPDFPATEPMALDARPPAPAAEGMQEPAAAQPLALEQLQLGQLVELLVSGHWMRLQLAWVNENATLCLFTSAGGANHSMTRRMFDRLVAQQQLRRLAQGTVVERAFDAVAELALRNSVYMDLQDPADREP